MQELIDFLRSCPDGWDLDKGICHNVQENFDLRETGIFDEAMAEVAPDWKYFSGNIEFPIKHQTAIDSIEAYRHHHLYEGEYGRRRVQLANLIADKLAEEWNV